jgi:hypothetical protein
MAAKTYFSKDGTFGLGRREGVRDAKAYSSNMRRTRRAPLSDGQQTICNERQTEQSVFLMGKAIVRQSCTPHALP